MKSAVYARALGAAFRLLKYRQRSVHEVRCRLMLARYGKAAVEEVLAFLQEKRFLDDEQFARFWIESRLKKPMGPARVRQELVFKGVDKELVERCMSDALADYSPSDALRELAIRRLEKCRGLDERAAGRRVAQFLIRRGFSPDNVWDAVNELMKAR
ncbi:MAG: regulatory protein RecX [Candidatus Omnitrophica bacterium]|nr:regulatory protein RecX [Candidatus Omnitrophota bacterium]